MFLKGEKPRTGQPGAAPPPPSPPAAGPSPGYAATSVAPTPVAEPPRPAAKKEGTELSIISNVLKIIGDLHSDGDIQIDGTVEGNVRSHGVTVGEKAHIEGSIFADMVRIRGYVKGQVEAQTVVIEKTAKMLGDIVHGKLAIEEGGFFEGQIRRIDAEKSKGGGSGKRDGDAKHA